MDTVKTWIKRPEFWVGIVAAALYLVVCALGRQGVLPVDETGLLIMMLGTVYAVQGVLRWRRQLQRESTQPVSGAH